MQCTRALGPAAEHRVPDLIKGVGLHYTPRNGSHYKNPEKYAAWPRKIRKISLGVRKLLGVPDFGSGKFYRVSVNSVAATGSAIRVRNLLLGQTERPRPENHSFPAAQH
jgi:hypothetical protein